MADTMKVRMNDSVEKGKPSTAEIQDAAKRGGPAASQPQPAAGPKRSGGAFAHVGAIGPQGRETYQKFSALFGGRPYPGANCGISILGSGSLANLRKLIQDLKGSDG